MSTLSLALIAATVTSLLGLTGGFLLLWKEGPARRFSNILLSFAAGTLLAAAFLDLLPEAIAESGDPNRTLIFTLAGIILFFLFEKSLLFHHHARHYDAETVVQSAESVRRETIRPLIIVGDALHNLLDGVILAAAFSVGTNIGIAAAVAVFFHELPQEIGDFGILLHTGMRRRSIALWNVLGALVSPIGVVIGFYALGAFEGIGSPFLAIATGGFIYIAAADIIPEIQHESRPRHVIAQVALLILGIALLWALGAVFPEVG